MSHNWQTLTSRTVYDNHWIRVSHREVVTPGGTDGIYGVVHFKNTAVGVLAVDEDSQIVLVGQYRYPLEAMSWEIPEGGCKRPEYCDAAIESTESCARRELAEETGLQATHYECFLELDLSNSITDEKAQIFLATGLAPLQDGHGYKKDDTEADILVKRVALDKAIDMIEQGEITDAISVAAIYKFRLSVSDS